MSSLTDKIDYLSDTKSAIRSAIESYGVEISDADTFRSYADKIAAISTAPTEKSLLQVWGTVDNTLSWDQVYGNYQRIDWGSGSASRGDALSYNPNTGVFTVAKDCWIKLGGTININGNGWAFQVNVVRKAADGAEWERDVIDSGIISSMVNIPIPEKIMECHAGDTIYVEMGCNTASNTLMRGSRSFFQLEEM